MRVQRLPVVLGLLFFFAQAAITDVYACYLESSQHFGQMSEAIRGEETDKPSNSETLHCLTKLRAYQNANNTSKLTARYFASKAAPEWARTSYYPTVNASSTWGQLFFYRSSSLFPYQSVALYKLKAAYRI